MGCGSQTKHKQILSCGSTVLQGCTEWSLGIDPTGVIRWGPRSFVSQTTIETILHYYPQHPIHTCVGLQFLVHNLHMTSMSCGGERNWRLGEEVQNRALRNTFHAWGQERWHSGRQGGQAERWDENQRAGLDRTRWLSIRSIAEKLRWGSGRRSLSLMTKWSLWKYRCWEWALCLGFCCTPST